MRKAWKVFRAIVSALLLLAVALPAAIYVLLSLNPIQGTVRDTAMKELSALLGAEVSIEHVYFHPFNTLSLKGINLCLEGDTIVSVGTVSAGFRLLHLLSSRELVFDYALIDEIDVNINRDSIGAPLNIAPIISRLKSDGPKEKRSFSLEISTLAIRRGRMNYDVLSAAEPDSGRFDPLHIHVSDIALNAYIPQISDNNYSVSLDHFSLAERSGFTLERLSAKTEFGATSCTMSDLEINLPNTHISFEPLRLTYESPEKIAEAIRRETVTIETKSGCTFFPPDFQAFVPVMGKIGQQFACDISASASLSSIDINRIYLGDFKRDFFSAELSGHVEHPLESEALSYDIPSMKIRLVGAEMANLLSPFVPQKSRNTISQLGLINAKVNAQGTPKSGSVNLTADGSIGNVNSTCTYTRYGERNAKFNINADVRNFTLGAMTGREDLGLATVKLSGEALIGRKMENGKLTASIERFDFKGYPYTGGYVALDVRSEEEAEVNVTLDDPAARLRAYAMYDAEDGTPSLMSTVSFSDVDLYRIGFDKVHEGYKLGAKINVNLTNADIKKLSGKADVSDFYWVNKNYEGLKLDHLSLSAAPEALTPEIIIDSPVIKGRLTGHYDFETLPTVVRDMALHFIPALNKHLPFSDYAKDQLGKNNFVFDFDINPWPELLSFFKLPFSLADDAQLTGKLDAASGTAYINFDAPYLRAGDKIIEGTSLFASLDMPANMSTIYATTQFGTKKGEMTVATEINVADNIVSTHIDWAIERLKRLNGTIDFKGYIHEMNPKPGDFFPIAASIDILPGTINFGDETWRISQSRIDMSYNDLAVFRFGLDADSQSIAIHGTVSKEDDDEASIALNHVSLLPIFETLDIDKALIGGRATGTFSASKVLTSEPQLECHKLHVDSIGYNRCTIGNADIYANWNNDLKAFYLDADIRGFEGRKSAIEGYIFPSQEALDINFDADSIPVGFLKPFMSAFANDISGRASGRCRLFGTFKEIDLEGDIYADNIKLGIDFTNTSYIATDSVHMRPGEILLDNVLIRDVEGHTARLDGVVRHKFFKEPTFKFDISKADELLSYNVTARQNPDWYGTIYGNGGASISGYPGVVNIKVDMSTASRSTFTFVLSDRLDAEDYSFLNFRDVTPDSLKHHEEDRDDTPALVRSIKREITAANQDSRSQYNMDIQVNVNPEATLRLVMDPVGKDEIEAHGSGTLHLSYLSANNDLNIWGKYLITSGNYHFTLQDIIHKDFTIKEGSEIQFDGDPYAVKTDLSAFYTTHANLSDLDESFLEDNDVARTNVPVHAIMNVSGDIRQPSIDFDLEFPTLTTDTYRKVRSIVSTPDMMNRQIIYLLTLNRFYTPDYMASTTKGNELFSVASSTLSSQLGNMLGKLSDNWRIAPNLRSDRGDFSDVEVDVALSSRLLNNRLIFNGNFGYRDKSLNTNQFIGDFDIEYLLNKRGNWRLKAYNRYNDRNFYFRSAQTTQGVGIMFRRDFDNLFNFLKKKQP